MKKIYQIAIIIISSGVFFACEKIVDWELPEQGDPLLVIEGGISDRKDIWKVRLTQSRPYFEAGSIQFIDNATVSISDQNGNTVVLNHADTGMYVSADSQQCVIGNSYTLNVDYDGQSYSATELCGYQEPIDTFIYFFLPSDNSFFEGGNFLFLKAQESPAPGDCYRWNIYINDTLATGFGGYFLETDELANASYLNPNNNFDDFVESPPRPFPLTVETGDSVRLEQWRINEEYYNFLNDLVTQSNRFGSPFDAPPANPRYNLSNGALGYFYVYSVQERALRVK